MEQKKEVKINIKADDKTAQGTYSNNHLIHMTHDEFVFDFLNVIPPHATLNARIVVSPVHFKRLVGTMSETIKKYESEFGTIELPKKAEESIQ